MLRPQPAEIASDHKMPKFGDGACHLDAGGSAADHDAGQQRLFFLGIGREFRLLEGEKQSLADQACLVDGLQPGRPGTPVLVAEIVVF